MIPISSKLLLMRSSLVFSHSVELDASGTKSKLVELEKTYASSVRSQNNRVEVDLAECQEI